MSVIKIGMIALISIVMFAACKEEWVSKFELLSEDSIYHNNFEGWKLSSTEEYHDSKLYNIKKMDGDTMKVLSFFNDGKRSSTKEYLKYYPQDTDTLFLKMKGVDTCYFYSKNLASKKFIVGEYCYRFEFLQLTDSEFEFYLTHSDSLRKVRGDGLPRLR